jgi:hypothetical protein
VEVPVKTLEDWLRAGASTAHAEESSSDVEDDANSAARFTHLETVRL